MMIGDGEQILLDTENHYAELIYPRGCLLALTHGVEYNPSIDEHACLTSSQVKKQNINSHPRKHHVPFPGTVPPPGPRLS